MKKSIKKTKDGKVIHNLTFCRQVGVYIGLIETSPRHFKSGMWSIAGVHLVRSTPNLNLSL